MSSLLVEFEKGEPSPFEQEPKLVGIYHWHEGLRATHCHENRLELNFILGGSGTHMVDGDLCVTRPGDMLVHNSKVLHDESFTLKSQVNAWCIAVADLKVKGLPENTLLPPGMHPSIPCQQEAERLGQLYPLVHHYACQPGGYPVADALARTIVLIAYEAIQKGGVAATSEDNAMVKRILAYMQKNYRENISLEDMAEMVNVNSYHMAHVFKKITGYSLQQYMLRRRIGKAQCYLIYTKMNLTEIAGRVGYDDSNYFSRVFKKIVGMSPRSYRQKWLESASGIAPSDIFED